jgi:cytochrome c
MLVSLAFLLLASTSLGQSSAERPVGRVEQGRALAQQNCQSCHAIGRTGQSPNSSAPVFRHLAHKYPIDNLSESFAEGVLIGHSVMPQFEFEPEQVQGLMAYLQSIQVRVPAKRKAKQKSKARH